MIDTWHDVDKACGCHRWRGCEGGWDPAGISHSGAGRPGLCVEAVHQLRAAAVGHADAGGHRQGAGQQKRVNQVRGEVSVQEALSSTAPQRRWLEVFVHV